MTGPTADGRLFAALASLLLALVASPAAALPPGAAGRAVISANQALLQLRLGDAAARLEEVPARWARDADVLRTRALLSLHRGEYAEAAGAIDDAVTARPDDRELASLRELIVSTRDATARFVTASSPDGRYVVRHAPGPDAVLVPYALEAMRRSDDALAVELGLRVPGPVRLEIYPGAEALATVSTLTVEAIMTTGTIALCKWDRLMITSPRALVRGYPWMDTISHEYVHLVLSRASRDRAPVWVQEGVAKLLERRWRGDPAAAHLDPAEQGLLSAAAREDRLLPFDRLHPSIALLPSQDDAALAFAQVATFFEGFHRAHGPAGLQGAIARIADGEDAREALAAVGGAPFASLEATWRARVRGLAEPSEPPPAIRALRFRGAGSEDDSSEVAERSRRFVRLGDLLWDRGRHGAAAAEYQKAHEAAPDDPIVASRLARAALSAGDGPRAVAAIERVLARYPEHAPAHAVLAAARLEAGLVPEAREAAREAIRLNPFDPEPHCVLGTAGADEAERTREAQACSTLGGPPRR